MKIPKTIIQLSYFKQPTYIVERFCEFDSSINYIHFNLYDIVDFIKSNHSPEFNNAIEIYNSLNLDMKWQFGKYYYLYICGGVFINNNSMTECDIFKYINNDINLFCVESVVNKNHIFNGFFGCCKNNEIVKNFEDQIQRR